MVQNMDIYKFLNISIGTVMKNPEMCNHAVKKLPYLLRYVLDRFKTQQMCDKAILEIGGTLKSVPDCYKNQEMCNKAVDNCTHASEFVPECFMTKEMCDKANNNLFYLILFLIGIKLKKYVTGLLLKILF